MYVFISLKKMAERLPYEPSKVSNCQKVIMSYNEHSICRDNDFAAGGSPSLDY